VSAVRHRRVPLDAKDPFEQTAWGRRQFFGKRGERKWHGRLRARRLDRRTLPFPIQVDRGTDRAREPIERDVREQRILREEVFDVAAAVAPRSKLLDDVGGKTRR
jgi:hypothetical protein